MIGSRWVPGGSIVNWPLHRELLSRGGNVYIRLLLGIRVRDATAGFRLFRRTTLEQIDLDEVESLGYVFQADLGSGRCAPDCASSRCRSSSSSASAGTRR